MFFESILQNLYEPNDIFSTAYDLIPYEKVWLETIIDRCSSPYWTSFEFYINYV